VKVEQWHDKLVVTDFDEFDACRIASKIEKDGIWFYEKLAQAVKKPEVRETLNFLVQEEKRHIDFFENELQRLRSSGEDKNEDDDLLTSMDFKIFEPYQEIKDLPKFLENISNALRLGMAIEDNSVRFYQACEEKVSGYLAKQELIKIIGEEKKHKKIFEDMLRSMV